eukprot:gb/GECH01004285.1/.p1 GENE.gb/GECH01004285.1/~~gb/GECH01004285.1/.p1  ORF type:complete len:969 (+),score=180.97 gb/GECH01004285.1/:1-2907(+)
MNNIMQEIKSSPFNSSSSSNNCRLSFADAVRKGIPKTNFITTEPKLFEKEQISEITAETTFRDSDSKHSFMLYQISFSQENYLKNRLNQWNERDKLWMISKKPISSFWLKFGKMQSEDVFAFAKFRNHVQVSKRDLELLAKNHYTFLTKFCNIHDVSFGPKSFENLNEVNILQELDEKILLVIAKWNRKTREDSRSNELFQDQIESRSSQDFDLQNCLDLKEWYHYFDLKRESLLDDIQNKEDQIRKIYEGFKAALEKHYLEYFNSPENLNFEFMKKENPLFRDTIKRYEEFNDQFRGKVIQTTYNGVPYVVEYIDIFRTPQSWTGSQENSKTFESFYSENWNLINIDLNQPLVQARFADFHSRCKFSLDDVEDRIRNILSVLRENRTVSKREDKNGMDTSDSCIDMELIKVMREEIPPAKKKFLLPQYCRETKLSPSILSLGKSLAKGIRHWKDLQKKTEPVKKLLQRFQIEFQDSDLLLQAFVHPSFASENQTKSCNNQRLEFLGDVVLDFVVSRFLFYRFQNAPENILIEMKTMVVENRFLEKVANQNLNLRHYLVYPRTQKNLKMEGNRLGADVFEALLGAIFLEHGMEKSFSFVKQVLLDQVVKELDSRYHDQMRKNSDKTELKQIINSEMESHLETLENNIFEGSNFEFQNKELLFQALCHASWRNGLRMKPRQKNENRFNNEGLKFLGESICRLSVSHYMFLNYDWANEKEMTIGRQSLLDPRKKLSRSAGKLELQKFILHDIPSDVVCQGTKAYENLMSDCFHAIMGACYVDSSEGFFSSQELEKKCFDVKGDLVFENLIKDENIAGILQGKPAKNRLQELSQRIVSKLPHYKIQLVEGTYPKRNSPLFHVEVHLENYPDIIISRSCGKTKKEAENNAATKGASALKMIQENHFSGRKIGKISVSQFRQELKRLNQSFPGYFQHNQEYIESNTQIEKENGRFISGLMESVLKKAFFFCNF